MPPIVGIAAGGLQYLDSLLEDGAVQDEGLQLTALS